MIWSAFGVYDVSSEIKVRSKVDRIEYIQMLDEHFSHEFRKCLPRYFDISAIRRTYLLCDGYQELVSI